MSTELIHIVRRFAIPVCPSCESMHLTHVPEEYRERWGLYECSTCRATFNKPDSWLGEKDVHTGEYRLA